VRSHVRLRAAPAVALILAVLIGWWWWYASFEHHHVAAQARPAGYQHPTDALRSTNASLVLATADHFYWLNNGPTAAPLYARAEELFSQNGDKRNELHAHIGRLRSQAETMSFVDLSRYLGEQLETPPLKEDMELRLWCLIAKGYTDIEIDYRTTKRDWLEARDLAKSLGHDQWVTRANGELGLAFLEGNQGHAARLLGGALLSTMASGDVGGQIRFLELLGRGFEEVNRHAEAMRFFDRAIKLANGEKDSGLPFMAYEGKAQALLALGKANDARAMLEGALVKARAQQKRGHEAQLLTMLGTVAEDTGDKTQAIQYLEHAAQSATSVQSYRMEADATFELAKLYRDSGDLAKADARATEGLAASQRVGDRYYVPRNLTILADLKARRGRIAEANALYERAENVIEDMLVSVDEPYWNSSVAASRSETYLQHFELAANMEDVPNAFRILQKIRGRTLAWALKAKNAFAISEPDQAIALETEVANIQGQLMQATDSSKREQLLDQLVEYERRLGLARTRDDVANQRLPVQPITLRSIQDELRPDEVLLEYVLDDPNSFCLSITRSSAQLHRLPSGRKEIERLTHGFIDEVRAKQSGDDASRQLFRSLLQPVPETVHAARLIIVPDSILNLLPFEALRSGKGQYLLRSTTVSYVPSATILWTLRRANGASPAGLPLLAVGDVPYEGQGRAGERIPEPTSFRGRVERGIADFSGMALSDLPETREEIEEIGKLAGSSSVLLIGKDATETAFRKEPLDQFRVLHLAVHGFADTQYPERSALVLGADPKAGEDGLLQVREIIRLRLNAQLTTLSACDTGVGKLQGQEGISNLVEAFLVSGSRSVVASLWNAEDTSTSAFMEGFYDRLAHGEDTSTALRNAKLDLLMKFGDQLSPYYWAEFVGVGETSTPVGIAK
jgi:CHAT domain-containing protein